MRSETSNATSYGTGARKKKVRSIVAVVAVFFAVSVIAVAAIALFPSDPTKRLAPDWPKTVYRPGGTDCGQAHLRGLDTTQRRAAIDKCSALLEQHRLDRLNADQAIRSADAAEAATQLNYEQAKISIAGVAVSLLTLLAAAAAAAYARGAVHEAKRGADFAERMALDGAAAVSAAVQSNNAMREANRIASETASIQLRPWLVVAPELISNVVFRDRRMEFTLSLQIKNVGQTLARNILVMSKTHPDQNDMPPSHFDETFSQLKNMVPWGDILAPGENMEYRIMLCADPEADAEYMWPVAALLVSYTESADRDRYQFHTSPVIVISDKSSGEAKKFRVGQEVLKENVIVWRSHGQSRAD